MHRILLLATGWSVLMLAGCGSESADPEPRAPLVEPDIIDAPQDLPAEGAGSAPPASDEEAPLSGSTTLEMPPEDYQPSRAESEADSEEGGFRLPPELNSPER